MTISKINDKIDLGFKSRYSYFKEYSYDDHFIISLDSIRHHLLMAGDTGSGKTSAALVLINELIKKGIKIWVFECTKRDYRNLLLLHYDNFLHFTPSENLNPIQYNPFSVPRGVSVAQHIRGISRAISDSYGMEHPLPEILEKAIERAYRSKMWRIESNIPPVLTNNKYPLFHNIFREIDLLLNKEYSKEIRTNIISALNVRLRNLTSMGSGLMYNTKNGISIDELYNNNIVFELEHFGDDYNKRLFVSLLLVAFHEFIRSKGISNNLKHVIIIEEAHRILSTPTLFDSSASSGRMTVKVIENLIREARSLGEGIILIDQSPHLLPEGPISAIKNVMIHDLKDQDSTEFLKRKFSIKKEIPDLYMDEVVVKVPHQELIRGKIRCAARPSFVSNSEISELMDDFYSTHPFRKVLKILSKKNFLLGMEPYKVDKAAAEIEYKYLVEHGSSILNDRIYPIDKCYENIALSKFLNPDNNNLIDHFQSKLELINFKSNSFTQTQKNFLLTFFSQLMSLAVYKIPDKPCPLPAIILFFRIVVFRKLNFSFDKLLAIYELLIFFLSKYGRKWIENER